MAHISIAVLDGAMTSRRSNLRCLFHVRSRSSIRFGPARHSAIQHSNACDRASPVPAWTSAVVQDPRLSVRSAGPCPPTPPEDAAADFGTPPFQKPISVRRKTSRWSGAFAASSLHPHPQRWRKFASWPWPSRQIKPWPRPEIVASMAAIGDCVDQPPQFLETQCLSAHVPNVEHVVSPLAGWMAG